MDVTSPSPRAVGGSSQLFRQLTLAETPFGEICRCGAFMEIILNQLSQEILH